MKMVAAQSRTLNENRYNGDGGIPQEKTHCSTGIAATNSQRR
jgi:hypothetical protein